MQKEDPILLHNYIRLVCAHWIDFDLLRHIAFTKFKSIPKTSRLDELHRVHLLPLTVEHGKKESRKKKNISVPLSHSGFLMPQSASYSPVVQRPSNESQKLRDERKWECGANLPVLNEGYLLCAGDRTRTSMYMCKPPADSTKSYSCSPLGLEIGSTVCCMIEVGPFWILGTSNGWLYGIDRITQQMLWKSELKETPLCFFVPDCDTSEDPHGRLYLGLANGKLHSFTLQGLPTTLQDGLMLPELFPTDMVVVGLGSEPISCLESPGRGMVCCGVGGRICVFETDSTQQLYEMIVSTEKRRSVREMRNSDCGLWVSLKGSCSLLLYKIQYDSHALLHKIDFNPYIQPSLDFVKYNYANSTLPQASKDNRATCLLVRGEELWIGTHNGYVLVFIIVKEQKDILDPEFILSIQSSMEQVPSVFGTSDEIPLVFVPSSAKQETISLRNLLIEKISEFPIRVMLECNYGESDAVLTAAGTVGEQGSVRVWKKQPSGVYNSYFVPFVTSGLETTRSADPNRVTPQVDCTSIIGFGCDNSLSYCENYLSPDNLNASIPLSPIPEDQVNGFVDTN